jgi:hypothetical protein
MIRSQQLRFFTDMPGPYSVWCSAQVQAAAGCLVLDTPCGRCLALSLLLRAAGTAWHFHPFHHQPRMQLSRVLGWQHKAFTLQCPGLMCFPQMVFGCKVNHVGQTTKHNTGNNNVLR